MDVLEMLPSEERLSNHDEEWGSIEEGGEGLTTTVDNLDNSMAGVGTTGNNHGVTSDAPKTSRAMISGLDRESVGHLVSARAE
ncbi:hypothetical protein CJ030_MR0G008859 [Morella rubra]|uniref:Uncharacterized protein n=1 Tax=Morella rubra TaxID=262757 RepID=A0A6A1UI61_9ROSI|nr:hypothetical protein CJ030_MR0G008859 [Morella rubra]